MKKHRPCSWKLKHASPTPSNTGSARSFQGDWERVIKVLRYCEVLQQGGAEVNRCATRTQRITCTATYGPGRAPLRGYIGLHLIFNSIYSTATGRRWAMLHSNTPQFINRAPLTARSSSLRWVSAAEHYTTEPYSKTGRTKQLKHLQRSDLLWNTCQDFIQDNHVFEKLLRKPSEDASQRLSWNQMSLPIYRGYHTPSVQFCQ